MRPNTEKAAKNYGAVLILVLLAVSVVYVGTGGTFRIPQKQSVLAGDILPGFEGETGGMYGETPQGTQSAISLGSRFTTSPLGSTYGWVGTPTPGSASIDATTTPIFTCISISCDNTLVVDTQTNPVTASTLFSTPEKVDYYVAVPNQPTKLEYVTGQVEVYTYSIDISIQSGSAGTWSFNGDTVWFNLYAVDWNQAVTDPSNPTVTGSAYEVPLYGVVTSYQWSDQDSNGIDAAVNGHAFSFYSSPSAQGQTLATLAGSAYNPSSTDVNATLSGTYAPDSRFPTNGLVYYPITLTTFHANPASGGDCQFGCTYPSVHLDIELYTLRIGEYIVTNPNTTGLGSRSQSCTGLACIPAAFGSLYSWIEKNPILAGLIASLGVGLVVVIILAVFATPVVVAVVYALSKRGQKTQ